MGELSQTDALKRSIKCRNLLNAHVSLDVDLPVTTVLNQDSLHGGVCQTTHQIAPAAHKLCSKRALNHINHLSTVGGVHSQCHLVHDLKDKRTTRSSSSSRRKRKKIGSPNLDGVLKSLVEGLDDDCGVHLVLNERQGNGQDFSSFFITEKGQIV